MAARELTCVGLLLLWGCGSGARCLPRYRDADGDGYGDPAVSGRCEAPADYIRQAGDCDDGNAAINPEGVEACDPEDADEDCDGGADDADSGAVAGLTEYCPDIDGDGFGDSDACVQRCDAPTGYIAESTDCDDSDAAVHPGASDTRGDGIDGDCNGMEAIDVSVADATMVFDDTLTEHDSLYALLDADVDGDGYHDLVVASPGTEFMGAMLGAVYVLPHPLTGTMTPADATTVIRGLDQYGFGYQLSSLGDVDGSGTDDLLIAGASPNAFLFLTPVESADGADLSDGSILADSAALWVTGETPSDQVFTAGYGGDLDGDGIGDMLVTATSGGVDATFAVSGTQRGRVDVGDVAFASVTGVPSPQWAQAMVGGVDLDGDGLDDFVLGSERLSDGALSAVYIFHGPIGGSNPADQAACSEHARTENEQFGDAISVADFDGDGHPDLAFARAWEPTMSGVHIIYGPLAESDCETDRTGDVLGDDDATIGLHLESPGDVDGDGADELAVASWSFGPTYLFNGPLLGTVGASDARVRIGDTWGYTLAASGDRDPVSGGGLFIGTFESVAYLFSGDAMSRWE